MRTMKAAVLRSVGAPLAIEQVPLPELGPDDVLVETRACGICGTDLHIQDGWGYRPNLPFVPGHEPSGVVAEVGQRVSQWHIGDRVIPNIFYTCGDCFYCRTNRETQCTQLDGILGVLTHWGGFGQFFRIPARQLFQLPDHVAFSEGAVIADAIVTAVHAVERGRVAPGETVSVIGVGGCGSAAVQVCRMRGARVIGVDCSGTKCQRALELGADTALNSNDGDVSRAIREATNGAGAECVIDTVGSRDTLQQAVAGLCRGGRLVILGYTQARYPLDPREIAVHELEILGTRSGGRQCTVEAIGLVARPDWKPIVTDVLPIDRANEALRLLRDGRAAGRIVLTFE